MHSPLEAERTRSVPLWLTGAMMTGTSESEAACTPHSSRAAYIALKAHCHPLPRISTMQYYLAPVSCYQVD
jgi:hypothetical protein